MAGGFAKDGAVQEQIDATIEDAVKRARDQLPQGESLTHCEECDKIIPLPAVKPYPVYACVSFVRRNTIKKLLISVVITGAAAKTVNYVRVP